MEVGNIDDASELWLDLAVFNWILLYSQGATQGKVIYDYYVITIIRPTSESELG